MGEALRGQHGEGVTWRAEAGAQNKPRHPGNGGAPRQAATHCRCTRGGPPCAPAPDCQRASNGARRAGTRASWTEGDLGEPRYAEACAFYVLLCSFETTPMKTQRNKTSWSSTPRNKRLHFLCHFLSQESASDFTTPSGGRPGQISGLADLLQTCQIQRPSQEWYRPTLTCITLLLRPVMSASFCSVWASGLLSWANWACMIWKYGR